MNYKKNYTDYIKFVKKQKREKYRGVYYEEHHIKPRSLGGGNDEKNLVLLTPREHFLAHYLLCKIYATGDEHYKMLCAFNLFLIRDESVITECNSKTFEKKKLAWIQQLKESSREQPKKKQTKKKTGKTKK